MDRVRELWTTFRVGLSMITDQLSERISGYTNSVLIDCEEASSSNGEIHLGSRIQHDITGGYTELMGGSVPCPSCNGSGRIPKELERELVALIPLSDDRLKPRRTILWVLLGVGICLLIAAFSLFFLLPRTVSVSSNHPAINRIKIDYYEPGQLLRFHFMNSLNISNGNFYSIRVVNISSTIISTFNPYSQDIVGSGLNTSSISIPPKAVNENSFPMMMNNSAVLKGPVFKYCISDIGKFMPLFVTLQFRITVTVEYFGHSEQITYVTAQQICCLPTGDCSSI